MSNARIIEIPATRQIRSGKNNTMRKMRRPTAASAPRKKNNREVLKRRNCTTLRKSTQPQNGNWPGFMPTTVSPASIQKSVTDLTR